MAVEAGMAISGLDVSRVAHTGDRESHCGQKTKLLTNLHRIVPSELTRAESAQTERAFQPSSYVRYRRDTELPGRAVLHLSSSSLGGKHRGSTRGSRSDRNEFGRLHMPSAAPIDPCVAEEGASI